MKYLSIFPVFSAIDKYLFIQVGAFSTYHGIYFLTTLVGPVVSGSYYCIYNFLGHVSLHLFVTNLPKWNSCVTWYVHLYLQEMLPKSLPETSLWHSHKKMGRCLKNKNENTAYYKLLILANLMGEKMKSHSCCNLASWSPSLLLRLKTFSYIMILWST